MRSGSPYGSMTTRDRAMTGTEALVLVLVLCAPVTLALVVGMLLGYDIRVRLSRRRKGDRFTSEE